MESIANPRGVKVESFGNILVFAPLSLGALERLKPQIDQLNAGEVEFGAMIDIAHSSLQRNYPQITREQVGDFVDLGNVQEVMQAVMNASGMVKKSDAEGGAVGE